MFLCQFRGMTSTFRIWSECPACLDLSLQQSQRESESCRFVALTLVQNPSHERAVHTLEPPGREADFSGKVPCFATPRGTCWTPLAQKLPQHWSQRSERLDLAWQGPTRCSRARVRLFELGVGDGASPAAAVGLRRAHAVLPAPRPAGPASDSAFRVSEQPRVARGSIAEVPRSRVHGKNSACRAAKCWLGLLKSHTEACKWQRTSPSDTLTATHMRPTDQSRPFSSLGGSVRA